MVYFIQVNIYAGLMYVLYLGLLRNCTGHRFSRAYLLLNAILPIILPLVRLHINTPQASSPVASIILPVVDITSRSGASLHAGVSMQKVLLVAYISLAVLLLIRFVVQVVRLRYFIKQCPAEHWEDTKLIRHANTTPGSWLNYIFLPNDTIDAAILKHEQAHVRLGHSYDLLLLRVLQCIFWPHLILLFIIREIKVVHEFQADNYSANGEGYITAMLNDTFGTNSFSLAHTFFHHPLKRRIAMLQKTNKSRPAYVLTTILSLIMLASILLVQCAKPNAPKTVTSEVNKDSVYTYVDNMPKANYDVNQFIIANLKYPDAARVKSIEGEVIARFVVDENGKITDITILNSPDSTLSNAALDVIKKLPDWAPGELHKQKVKVFYVMPISFKLN